MPKFEVLSQELTEKIEYAQRTGNHPQVAFPNDRVIRRQNIAKDQNSVWRPSFVHDIDKVMHCPYYNRYTDKTQVFSLYKNDDLTRRSLHVQLVSRIARTIGAALHLNLDLIEAISLSHDIGHTPFAHTGEVFLDELYYAQTGLHFSHNIHSVRVLDRIFPYNISLQTLDGIATHNGELECEEYYPRPLHSFEEFDRDIRRCYEDKAYMMSLMPSTLEANVVRLSDIIAYLGKDRQDAALTKLTPVTMYSNTDIGSINSEIINNLVVNVIENSYEKPYIKLDAAHFEALRKSKMDNYSYIYNRAAAVSKLSASIKPMMENIYGQLLEDLKKGNKYSPVFTHHIDYVNSNFHRKRETPYEAEEPNDIVVDYIASMTDNYFIDLHAYLFPNSPIRVEYKGYFDEETMENTAKKG